MSLDSGYFNMSYNCNNYHANISETNIINLIFWGNYYIRNTITNKEYSLSYVYNSHSNNLELFESDDGYCMSFHIMNRNYDYELIHNSTDIDKEGINCIIKMFNNFINDRNKYVFLYGESKLLHLKKYKRHDLVRLDDRLQFKEGYEFINNSKNITAHRFYVYDFDDDGVILADVGCFASGCNVELGKIYNVPYDWVASMCGEIHNDDIDVLINNKMKLLKPVYGKEILLSEFNSLMNTNVINENNIYIELNDNDDPYYIWPGENLYHYNISGSKIWIAVIRCKDFDYTNLFEGNEYEGKIFVNELKTEFYMEGDELEVVKGNISFKHNFITKEITNIKGDKNSIYKSIEAFKRMRESICDYNQYIIANETIINYLKKYF